MKDNFELGEKLESVFPLLDLIFEYLNDSDLDRVMKVKKSWEAIARRILNKRSSICWMTCYQDHGSIFFRNSGNLHCNNANAAIILFGRRYNLNEYISLHEETNTLHQMRFVEYFNKEVVSRNIEYCVLTCPKIVSYFAPDIKNKYGSIFDTLFLPEIPGIKTSIFYCNFSKLKKSPSILENHIKSTEEVKCLLLFGAGSIGSSVDNLLKIILKGTKPQDLALGGGIIYGIDAFNKKKEVSKVTRSKNETLCIAFSQQRNSDPDFTAVSFVIKGSELSENEIHEKLLQFKKSILMRTMSFALRICCHAKRGKKKESVIFNSHFPNTPLLGLEVAGEIGWNSSNISPEDEHGPSKPKKTKKAYPIYEHEWSTVFIVITWGKQLET